MATVRVAVFGPHPDAASASGVEATDPTFARDWNARLARAPHANFSLSLDYLARQAEHGEVSRAVLLDDAERHGAMVLRERPGELVCGLPWRWQMIIEGADPARPEGMTAADAEWFFAHARRLTGTRRLRFYTPHRLRWPVGYLAGTTVLIPLANRTEQQLLASMQASRRQWSRRSQREGYQVTEGISDPVREDFVAVVEDNGARRHGLKPERHAGTTGASEWAEPWHWLLVAIKDDAVVGGLGLGRLHGGMVDARASGTTEPAMKVGTNTLVWWEALRRASAAGHTWMNLCGATAFKREFGGLTVDVHCALAGPVWWALPNAFEMLRWDGVRGAVRARNRLRESWRARRGRNGAHGKNGRTKRPSAVTGSGTGAGAATRRD